MALAGCSLLAPYDPTLDEKTTAAYQTAMRLAAKIELGAFADPASYDAASDEYADALVDLDVARLRAETASPPRLPWANERPPTVTSPTDLLAGCEPASLEGASAGEELRCLIAGCEENVKSLAEMHKSRGVPPRAGFAEPVQIACETAYRAARALAKK